MKKRIIIKVILLTLIFLFLSISLWGADLIVPEMELITRGYIEDSSFNLGTRGTFDFLIAGGYKFGGRIVLNLESDYLEDLTTDKSLQFKAASITLRDIFSLPISLSYFTGSIETLCSGDMFPERFGTERIATRYRGYVYFPDGIRYDGISAISGTGLALSSTHAENFITTGYVYQDAYLGMGKYSVDIHTILNLELIKLEAFIGSSFPMSAAGIYRAGLLLFYKTESGGEFLTQIGIPRWDPMSDPFNIDLFYFLFEPRIKLNKFSIILTLFWHPNYYLQSLTNELGSVDINVNFLVGNPEVSPLSGGIESSLKFSTTRNEQFQAFISPYLSAVTSGVLWNFKVNTKVFPFVLENLVEFFVGVKAEF